jgi:hypothetical protein
MPPILLELEDLHKKSLFREGPHEKENPHCG